MKKLLFIAAISLGVVVGANAQETKFGVKAGLNLANVSGDDVEDNSMLIGFQIGGYAHLGLSDAFAIQPELLFDMKGSKTEFGDEDVSTNLSYISVPVLAKYMITEELDLHLGPQVGILMSAKTDGEDVKDFYKSTDFGLAAGAGYELDSGLNFSARYSTSLSSISDNDDVDVKNSVVTIAVGYSF